MLSKFHYVVICYIYMQYVWTLKHIIGMRVCVYIKLILNIVQSRHWPVHLKSEHL